MTKKEVKATVDAKKEAKSYTTAPGLQVQTSARP